MSVASKAGRLAGALAAFVCVATIAGADDLAQLQREWWQWIMATPASHSPVYDKTGKFCTMGQRGDYWFLAGSTGSSVTRSCTVPKGVKLFVPVINNFCFPDPSYGDQACTAGVAQFMDGATGQVDWNGVSKVVTPVCQLASASSVDCTEVTGTAVFNIAVGPNGFGGVKPGVYRVNAVGGLWATIPADTVGSYTLTVTGTSGDGFSQNFSYVINVVEPAN